MHEPPYFTRCFQLHLIFEFKYNYIYIIKRHSMISKNLIINLHLTWQTNKKKKMPHKWLE